MNQEDNLETCIFCAVANGREPAHFVQESRNLVAFLDLRPIRPGHVQIVPRAHTDCFDKLSPELAAEIVQLGSALPSRRKHFTA